MYHKIAVYLSLIVGLASAETIKLSGKVTSQNGNPVKGAVVSLVGQKMSDTTDNQGKFSISSVGVERSNNAPQLEKIYMNKGSILFSLNKAAQVKIEVFDVSGNLLKKELNHYAAAGEYRFDLSKSQFAATMTAVRVTVDGRSSTFRYLLSSDQRYSTSFFAVPSKVRGLAKIKAVVDTLNVSANNFVTKVEPLNSYDSEINITLDTINLPKFSFFLTSQKALQELSKNEKGFGGDLRFGKTGQGAGILGADSICQCIAEKSMPGSKVKVWRAFLSATKGVDGKQVNAIERIGSGPWYDRKGRLFANNISELLNDRPTNAHSAIKNDFPNEEGIPNKTPDPLDPEAEVDNHLTVTGTGADGKLFVNSGSGGGGGFGFDMGGMNCGTTADYTCSDWTSTTADSRPRAGFSWPQQMGGGGMRNWISTWCLAGCEAGYDLDFNTGAGVAGVKIIGSGGGYGGFYCFARNP